MLLHQLFAIIIYSCWHYGRVFHQNQKGLIDFQQAFGKVLLILMMSYFLFAKTLLFFAIIMSKLFYDIFYAIVSPSPVLITEKNKWNLYDAVIGLLCCVVYIIG